MQKAPNYPSNSKNDLREDKIFYLGKWRKIQPGGGWPHVDIRTKTGRRLIGVEQIERERLHGQSMPVYFGYIFEGLHQSKPNAYFDQLLSAHDRH